MKRYWTLIRIFARSSLLANLEYRANFLGAVLTSGLDALWSVGAALAMFSHRPTLGGWTFHETLVVIGLFIAASALLDVAFQPNMRDVVEQVRTGAMDFTLLKPINAQFHATLRRYRLERLSGLGVGGGLIVYALGQLGGSPPATHALAFAILGIAGAVVLYAVMATLSAIAFWAVDLQNLDVVVVGLLDMARYPASAFPEPVRGVILTVIPVALITTVPAEALLGRLTLPNAALSLVISGVVFFASIAAWKLALRHYTSASS